MVNREAARVATKMTIKIILYLLIAIALPTITALILIPIVGAKAYIVLFFVTAILVGLVGAWCTFYKAGINKKE